MVRIPLVASSEFRLHKALVPFCTVAFGPVVIRSLILFILLSMQTQKQCLSWCINRQLSSLAQIYQTQ